ncbi:MAG: YidC/Oxa1 family insertase periplasmic-domain containing protein [Blastocatellia bacterium]|nr:YidC/Oxa1 family insertase periplasmic-domain containing protein [Blastocatellia bacterium]
MDRTRITLALVLSAVVIIGWPLVMNRFFPPSPKPAADIQSPATEQQDEKSQSAGQPTPPSPTTPPTTPAPASPQPQETTEAALQEFTVETYYWKAKFSNRGAVATSWNIKKKKNAPINPDIKGADGRDLELIPQDALDRVGAPFRLHLPWSPDLTAHLNQVHFEVEGVEPGQQAVSMGDGEKRQITFVYSSPSVVARKTFTFYGGRFDFDFTAGVESNGVRQPVYTVLGPRIGDQADHQTGTYSTPPQVVTYDLAGEREQYLGAGITPAFGKITSIDQAANRIQLDIPLAGDIDRINIVGGDDRIFIGEARVTDREAGGLTLTLDRLPEGVAPGNGVAQGTDTIRHGYRWAGVVDRYFSMVAIPELPINEAVLTNIHLKSSPQNEAPREYPSLAIPVRPDSVTHIFVGPKERDLLVEAGERYGTDLEALIDYGMFAFMIRPIIPLIGWALDGLGKVFHNYGWGIVVVTIIINLAMSPLRWYSSKKMKKAAKHQPRMKELQEQIKKYKNDPKKNERELQQLQQEQMALMKEANPLGGCMPLLLQMPIFWSFFVFLTISLDVRQAPWIFWIKDLSTADPYYALPLVMCVSMIASTKLTPQPATADPQMKMQRVMMTWLMPIMLTGFFFISAPSGLVLYWMVSNMVGVGIQLVINKITTEPDSEGQAADKKESFMPGTDDDGSALASNQSPRARKRRAAKRRREMIGGSSDAT